MLLVLGRNIAPTFLHPTKLSIEVDPTFSTHSFISTTSANSTPTMAIFIGVIGVCLWSLHWED